MTHERGRKTQEKNKDKGIIGRLEKKDMESTR